MIQNTYTSTSTVCCDLALIGFSVAFLIVASISPPLGAEMVWPYTGAIALRVVSRFIGRMIWGT